MTDKPVRITDADETQLALDTVVALLDAADPEDPRFWVAVEYAAGILETWSRHIQDTADGQ